MEPYEELPEPGLKNTALNLLPTIVRQFIYMYCTIDGLKKSSGSRFIIHKIFVSLVLKITTFLTLCLRLIMSVVDNNYFTNNELPVNFKTLIHKRI